MLGRVPVQPGKHLGVHPSDPARGIEKPGTAGVFANGPQDRAHRLLYQGHVHPLGTVAGFGTIVVLAG
jgi:hypothetical protein